MSLSCWWYVFGGGGRLELSSSFTLSAISCRFVLSSGSSPAGAASSVQFPAPPRELKPALPGLPAWDALTAALVLSTTSCLSCDSAMVGGSV